jgi:hypothetical protein
MKNSQPMAVRIRHFFYDQEVPYGLALCRISLPLVLMGMALPRWLVCRELYSSDGATAQLSVGYGYIDLLPEFPGTIIAALFAVMLFAMVSMSVGWCSRVSSFITGVIFTYLCALDCVSTMTKYTVIATHLMFILSVSECGAIWSVDAWLANRRRNLNPTQPRISYPRSAAWPRRLIQLHISCVYFGAAMTKLHTPSFFTGDQLQYWMLTHLNYQHPIGELLSLYPIMLVALSYVTVVWEVTFILTSWKSAWRGFVLPIGILFHFMTTLTLGLLMFPMVCYCTYFAFIDEEDLQQSAAWMRRRLHRFDWLKRAYAKAGEWRLALGNRPQWRNQARVAFALAIPIVAVIGIQIEYLSDVYGERRAEGPHQLTAIDPDRARALLAPVTPRRDIDKFFAVDMGTFLVSDLLADRRTAFRQGEQMIAQCNLIPPHEDMVIECKIRDSDHRIIERIMDIGTREMFRVNIHYRIPDALPPGEYFMTVETAGRHVMKKKFDVLPKYGTVAAR